MANTRSYLRLHIHLNLPHIHLEEQNICSLPVEIPETLVSSFGNLTNAYLDGTYMQADFSSTRQPPPLRFPLSCFGSVGV